MKGNNKLSTNQRVIKKLLAICIKKHLLLYRIFVTISFIFLYFFFCFPVFPFFVYFYHRLVATQQSLI